MIQVCGQSTTQKARSHNSSMAYSLQKRAYEPQPYPFGANFELCSYDLPLKGSDNSVAIQRLSPLYYYYQPNLFSCSKSRVIMYKSDLFTVLSYCVVSGKATYIHI